ncbi:MAG: DUF6562 domain-containing protein [Alistipes sp.]|nr:DUF6562 domain-containing protein [Alistipes sp.]
MKKIFALLALMLGVVSCQTEPEGLDVSVGGEQEVAICVSLPEATRANSAEGAFANVDLEKYTIRYILQVYYNGQPSRERLVKYSDGNSVTFPVRLVPGRDYNFVVWADLVEGNNYQDNEWYNEDGLHYNTENLHAITLKDTWVAMDETRDAFTATQLVEDYSSTSSINITLKRPFAKLRVVTTDMVELGYLGIEPHNAVATYTTKHYESFNACNGSYAGEVSGIEHTYEIVSYGETGANKTIFADYFFANNEVVKFNLDVKEANGETIKKNTFSTDIYVRRNHLTTIQGNILTDGNNVEVNVNPAFDGYTNYNYPEVYTENDLQAVINAAEDNIETVIYLGKDIKLTRTLNIPLQKVITLDLNGKQVTTTFAEGSTTNHIYAIDNKGTLKIKADKNGECKITARGIFNYGTMTLESGIIDACDGNGGYGVRNYAGAKFVMNGGSIVTSYEDDNQVDEGGYDATTLRIDEGATATINGGTINNICDFTFAIDNAGKITINGGTITSVHSTVSTYGDLTINGGTFTCNGKEGVSSHTIIAWDDSETTINGGTFDGKDNYNGYNVYASAGAEVNIYGGEFKKVHSGSLYGEGTINVMGGFYFDDPTARVATGYLTIKINDTLYTVMKGSVENGVNTYVVENTMDLSAFSSIVDKGATFKGQTVKLANDIDCFKGYMEDGDPISTNPIGRRDYTKEIYAFCGTFDGDGHSIKNLYQNGWALGYELGVYGAIGLFSKVQNATIKNLTMDGCEMFVEGGNVAVIAGNAEGDCTFENITIKNSTVCSYNNGVAGIVAWSETGNYTFKNIVLEDTFTVASFWGAHGTYLGGVVAEVYADCSYKFEDIVINCRLDAYNDVVSNYQWYAYRCGGMIAGNVETTQEINGTVYPNPAGCNITCSNVTVNYGDWMNYHYCESPSYGKPSYADEGEWKFHRVEPGYSWAGVDHANCNHGENESHYVSIPFDQLFGGGQNGSGHNPVYGLREYEGVTVNYPASYRREVSTAAALTEALNDGLSVVLDADIDLGSTQLAITGENQVVDLNGKALTTANNWGGISLKNGATIKNGTITHTGNTAALKAFNGTSVENVTINATCTTADKTVTGIAVQQGANIESIKNVTINGVSQGIEVGYQATVGLIENAVVNESNNGTAKGIGLVINGGMVSKAKNCTFIGDTYGITLHLKGVFAAGLDLENCEVKGGTHDLYTWDEKGISNTSGSLVLTYDDATEQKSGADFIYADFEEECTSVVRIKKK